jgi:hypothetical protein
MSPMGLVGVTEPEASSLPPPQQADNIAVLASVVSRRRGNAPGSIESFCAMTALRLGVFIERRSKATRLRFGTSNANGSWVPGLSMRRVPGVFRSHGRRGYARPTTELLAPSFTGASSE